MVDRGTGGHNCGAIGGCPVLEQSSAHFCQAPLIRLLVRRHRKVYTKGAYRDESDMLIYSYSMKKENHPLVKSSVV